MKLDGGARAQLLLLFVITMLSATTVAHGIETSGNGSGSVSCPGGESEKGEVSFSAFMKDDAPVYGSWEVVIDGSSGHKSNSGGYLDDGKISEKNYDLDGKESSSDLCGADKKAKVSIHGDCGKNSKIQVRADSGWKGTFEGDVDCD